MVVAVFLGLSLAQQRRSHIQMDVSQFAAPAVRRPLEALHHLSHGLLYALIAVFGWGAASHAFAVGEFAAGAYDFPIWPARLILAAGASLMTVQCAVDLVAVFCPALRSVADNSPAKPNTI
jgi:TRAP-type transport system small permease protein